MQGVPSQEPPAQLRLAPAAVVCVQAPLLTARQVQVPCVRAAFTGPKAVQAPSAAQSFAVADACAFATVLCSLHGGRQICHPSLLISGCAGLAAAKSSIELAAVQGGDARGQAEVCAVLFRQAANCKAWHTAVFAS